MTPTLPYREETRMPLAFSLSVLLHGLAVAAVVVFLWSHPTPPPPPTMIFELVAGPSSDTPSTDTPPSADPSLPGLPAPALMKLPPTPDATPQPQPTPEVRPQPQLQPTTTVKPAPALVKVTPPLPARNSKPASKPLANTTKITNLADWEKAHPAANPAPGATVAARRGTAPKVGIDVGNIVNPLTNAGARGDSRAPVSAGTSDDYVAGLVARLQGAFHLPGGVTGLSANVRLTIAADGKVVEAVPVGSSGNEQFDAAVVAALNSITQVDPPPGGQEVSYTFTYTPES